MNLCLLYGLFSISPQGSMTDQNRIKLVAINLLQGSAAAGFGLVRE